MSWGAPG
ncbi:hypothetical protein CP8484711_2561, partial [Chlamydia psittaci 84-8471/1]